MDGGLKWGPARSYYGRSLTWEFLEDPVPRLVLFLVCQQALLSYNILPAMLARARMALLVPARTSVIAAAGLGIAD
jgi:hypothetical protein